MEDKCYFQLCQSDKPLIIARSAHIHTIISANKARQDSKAANLELHLEADEHLIIKCQKDCVSSYTSNMQRVLKRSGDHFKEVSTCKQHHQSQTPTFNFKEHCLFCGETCLVEKDTKNPSRWKPAFLCRTAQRGEHKSFKQSILDICEICLAAVSDLHAADTRHHDSYRKTFMSPRSIASASRSQKSYEFDSAILATIAAMKVDMSRILNSQEIYNIYTKHGGTSLSRRTLLSKLSEVVSKDLLVLTGNGVASLVLFRS